MTDHRDDDRLVRAVSSAIEREGLDSSSARIVVGVSGGPDSLSLLHCLVRLRERYGFAVWAAHLNHRIRGQEADADAEFVRRICLEWAVPLVIDSIDVPAFAAARRMALEEAARQVRYGFLGRVAVEVATGEEPVAVAVAHNADDQVETVLMHFLRGSGLAGMRGMLPSVPLASLHLPEANPALERVRLIRPLLEVGRDEILAYCTEQGLEPRYDRTNLDTTYFRNRLREQLIPFLASFNPNITEVVRRTARLFAADYEFLSSQTDAAWARAFREEDVGRVVLERAAFEALPLSLRRALIRRAIARLRPALRNINWIHVERAVEMLQPGRGAGARADLTAGLVLAIGYDRFAIAEQSVACALGEDYPQMPPGTEEMCLGVPSCTDLPGGWHVSLEPIPAGAVPGDALCLEDAWRAYLDISQCQEGLVLRTRREGERMQPLGMAGHSKKINELMINLKLPKSVRERYPVLACQGAAGPVLWLLGLRLDERARVSAGSKRVIVARMWKG